MILVAPLWYVLPVFAAATGALGLALLLLWKRGGVRFYRGVAAVLGTAGLLQIANGMGLVDGIHALEWRRGALAFALLFPATLQYVGLVLLNSPEKDDATSTRWRTGAVIVTAVTFAVLAFSDLLYVPVVTSVGPAIGLGPLGRVAYVFMVLSLTLGLSQLEQILRMTRDPLRYRIKYVLIGLGGLAGYEIYQASRMLMVPVWMPEFALVGALATLTSLALVGFGFARLRLKEVRAKVYVSPQVLYGSVTVLVVGLYLLLVGLIGEVIRHAGELLSATLSVVVVFVAILGLVVVLFSRAAHARVRQFLARHFYRSKYDYRAKWLEVTAAFGLSGTLNEILDQLLQLLARTFGAGRLTIWIRYDADGRFHQVRSVNTEPGPRPLDAEDPFIARLSDRDDPLELDEKAWAEADVQGLSSLRAAQAILCVPIRTERKLIGFVTLSRQYNGEKYGQDDFDLLRAIAHHAGMLLSLARLAEEKSTAGELEALHRFSAFCLHDLKNLAAKLSLVVQNAEIYGQDPAFHHTAMRTVSTTVQKMMSLITKLSLQTRRSGTSEVVDVSTVIAETIGSMNGEFRVQVNTSGQGALVRIAKDELQQVLLNLLLNAQQGMVQGKRVRPGQEDICIQTERRSGSVIVTISDRGPGIPEDRLQTLFQPFKSTKPNGLGLGLYQCKRTVEEYGGSIRVLSTPGQGTDVQIELPIAKNAHGLPASLPSRAS